MHLACDQRWMFPNWLFLQKNQTLDSCSADASITLNRLSSFSGAYIYGCFRKGLLVYIGSFLLIYLLKLSRKKFSNGIFSSSVADYMLCIYELSWLINLFWVSQVPGAWPVPDRPLLYIWFMVSILLLDASACLGWNNQKSRSVSVLFLKDCLPQTEITGLQLFYWMTQPCFPMGRLKTAF